MKVFSRVRAALVLALGLSFVPAVFAQSLATVGGPMAVATPAVSPVLFHRGGVLCVELLSGLFGLGILGAVVITQVQPSDQPKCKFSFIADVTMAAGDGTATIPHGLGVAPLIWGVTPTLQGTALPFGGMVATADTTNITVTVSSSTDTEFDFRVWAFVPNSLLL